MSIQQGRLILLESVHILNSPTDIRLIYFTNKLKQILTRNRYQVTILM